MKNILLLSLLRAFHWAVMPIAFISLIFPKNMYAQNSVNIVLTDSTQIREAIIALREYNPHRGQQMWQSSAAGDAYDHSFGELANALELSLEFKVGHVLTSQGASLIQIALCDKKRRDDYAASPQGIQDKYSEEHPTYTLKNGERYNPPSDADESWGSNGYDSFISFTVGRKTISFKKIKPGIYQESK